ncbi:sporulation protein YpjB [Paenibacillus sp. JX-17]|uniref:Sporulation protein YpjB n=1 Tax=Paenibacillus lacisoli TaxID=3064525 RepID=A0ABT9C703_9BACL|nr:sporulation protein YpjB [Paenibacillus sp. JX-17]MDO7905045.1 sporulation protein YpjB [Paenibacillus sp. JX-17]
MIRKGLGAVLSVLCLLLLWYGSLWVKPAIVHSAPGFETAGGVKPSAAAAEFNQTAARLYSHVQEGNIHAVKEDLAAAVKLFEQGAVQGKLSVSGIHAMSEVMLELEQVTNNVKASPEAWNQAAARFRLAADSIANPQQPMWHQYYKLMSEDLKRLNQLAAAGSTQEIRASAALLRTHYDTMRTAALISRSESVVAQMDSWLSHVEGMAGNPESNRKEMQDTLTFGSVVLNSLFGKEKDESAMASFAAGGSPWMTEFGIAAFIIAALAYAGYRKYSGQNPWRSGI